MFSGCLAWLRAAGQWVLLQGGRELLVLGSQQASRMEKLLHSSHLGTRNVIKGREQQELGLIPFPFPGSQEKASFQFIQRALSWGFTDSSPLHFLHFIPSLLKISKCSSLQSWRGVTLIHEDEVKVRPSLPNLF